MTYCIGTQVETQMLRSQILLLKKNFVGLNYKIIYVIFFSRRAIALTLTLMIHLLFGLGNWNLESKLLTTFTSQNGGGNWNQNRNYGAHHNLGIENGEWEINSHGWMGMSLPFPKA